MYELRGRIPARLFKHTCEMYSSEDELLRLYIYTSTDLAKMNEVDQLCVGCKETFQPSKSYVSTRCVELALHPKPSYCHS